MKMFHFKCESYGAEATICAESLSEAMSALAADKRKPAGDWTDRHLDESHNATIDEMIAGNRYTVAEFEPMTVLWTEVS